MVWRRAFAVIYVAAASATIAFTLSRLYFVQASASPPSASPAQQDRPPMPRNVREACPRGYIIEFLIGGVTLYVDIDHIENTTIYEISHKYGNNCPTTSTKIHKLYLSHVADALGIQSGIGVDSERVWVEELLHKNPPLVADGAQSPAAPWIEDLDVSHPIPGSSELRFADVRRYRLHYQAEDGAEALPPEMDCGGAPIARLCRRMGYGYGGLGVAYSVSQPRLPLPHDGDNTSIDPATEPGALLQFELRLRAWILGMERAPAKTH